MKMIFWSKLVLLASMLIMSKKMESSGKQSQKLTLKPDDPTIVYKGDNVTFEWRYYYPSTGFKLIEVFFGIWTNPVSAASSKLIVVNSSGFVQFRKEYKARLSWKGNMTSSSAVFVLHNVRPEDGNKYYGIHVEFDLHYPLIDTLKLQVKEKSKKQRFTLKPSNPKIVYKGENVSLEWRYHHPKHMKLVEVFFGIWTNPLSAADKSLVAVNSSGAVEVREEYKSRLSWKVNVTSSVAVFVLHNVRPEDGNKYYGIHVEFDLHYPLIDTLKLQVETKQIEGSVKPSVSVVEGTFSRKTEGLVDGSLVAIIIALSVSVIIFTGLGCFLRIKCKPMKENPERHQDRRGITAYSFTPEMDLTSEAAQGTVEERTSVLLSETRFGIEDTSFMADQRETSIRNTEIIYKKPRASQCLLLATFKPEMNPTALETKPYELPTGTKTFNSSEECERSNSSTARTCLSEHNLQPSAGFENTENGRLSHGETPMVCSTRPRPKPRKKFNRKAPGTLSVECLRSNPLYDEAGVEHCARAKVSDQINIDGSTPQTFREKTPSQNASLPKALCKNAAYQNSSQLLTAVQVESPYAFVFSNKKWEVPIDHLSLIERIGGGTFGEVWKGRALDVCGTQGWSFVAVKMLKETFSKSDLTDLLSELDLLKKLKPHPNVIQLLGCLTKDVIRCQGRRTFKPPLVILEFVAHGDLLGFLKRSRGETDDYYDLKRKEIPRKISIQQLYKFASDIARGMEFISAHQLIHRDLAARNILVGEGLRCKITDFGMARDLGRGEIYVRRSNGVVPVKWMAVESLTKQVFTIKSDVWSYGIVLYEIFTLGGNPYEGMKGEEVLQYIANGNRLRRTSEVSPELYDLMLQCWQEDPFRRPTFGAIASWTETLA